MSLDRSEVLALLDQGLTYKEIGVRFGVTRQAVHFLAQRMGIDAEVKRLKMQRTRERRYASKEGARVNREARERWAHERIVRMAELYNSGRPAEEVAREVGLCGRHSLYAAIGRLRVDPEYRKLFRSRYADRGLDEAEQERALAAYEQGVPLRDIAAQLGYERDRHGWAAIWYYIRKLAHNEGPLQQRAQAAIAARKQRGNDDRA